MSTSKSTLLRRGGETSASPENKLDSNVDLDLNIFGQRIILKNKNLKADDNIRIRQNDSFGILNEPSREKGLQSVQKYKDPFRHMMEMFHNALKFVKIDNILTHEEDVYEKYERPRRLEKTRTIQQEINPVFNRIGLRDENEKVDVKTPPTPTTRPQAGQKRILTGTRRRKPSKIHRKPLVAIQMSTPPIRTLPPTASSVHPALNNSFLRRLENVVHHFPRHPLPSPPPPLLPTSPRINGDTPSKPFKPSPKIIEGNFVPSTQAWTTKTGATNNKVTSGRRPPVVPRVPIIPKTQIPKFITTNGISNSGEKYRKGKGLNDDQRVTNNKDLLELYSTPSNFQCTNQEYPGLYADLETNCQTFHMCQVGGRQNTFICPVGTLFDQRYLVCNWSNQVNCRNSVEFYNINRKIYKPTS
ncbi:unnamed protein product [Lepeophtheirus salmonis]|nr:unnamed protein product [Lepeophtheirus salmonis]CAF2870453.1 unnamed protein product [Lepeophtheirus salmonis]